MKITINTKILQKHKLSLGEFLLMLLAYFDIDLEDSYNSIIKKSLAESNVLKKMGIVLSNNSKELVAKILMESNDKVIKSNIDFEDLALRLMDCYPEGCKAGTTHKWRSKVEVIAQKLRVLVALYNCHFTEEEAIQAVKEYVSSFEPPYQNMMLLRSFILTTSKIDNDTDMSSLFMTYIENNR